MDEVPIPLRKLLNSPLPADHEILDAILRRVQETLQENSTTNDTNPYE